jgi:putative endonuclease
MATHNELGKKGEDLSLDFLCSKEYEILETNWRFSRAEIDIIAMKNGVLVFVEVKTRTKKIWGYPESFISKRKIQVIMDAAYHYMEMKKYEWEIRFDVISIILSNKGEIELEHFKDAFVP